VGTQSSKPSRESPPARGVGRLLPILLAAMVILGLGAGFAVGSTTKGKSGRSSSAALAPAIAVSDVHMASVPAPYAGAVLPTMRSQPQTSKKPRTASSGESATSVTSSAASESAPTSNATTTPATSAPASSPSSPSTPVTPPPKQPSSAPKSEPERVRSGSGGGA
jgi:hypothetical protein